MHSRTRQLFRRRARRNGTGTAWQVHTPTGWQYPTPENSGCYTTMGIVFSPGRHVFIRIATITQGTP